MDDPTNPSSKLTQAILDNIKDGTGASTSIAQDEGRDFLSIKEEEIYSKDYEQSKDIKSNRNMREKYTFWIFFSLLVYAVAILAIIFLQGFSPWGFSLNRWILIPLASGVSIYVIASALSVIHGLYRRNER